ncbi:energy transducer TonB [Alloacidobacterium dinghuense]|uniref:Energy transducer TonB n=1 Tax=Alloacidobacterium dinghuense TaxID=2763107 RepID=A0A7G8BDS6_9BACT|nr:energy transducer TonB [Alloacidobacterium dinghuense]QNI30696.1 energy transducer TonB [Alloacidobacterium dinghuense]
MRSLTPILLFTFAFAYAHSQVMQNTNYEREMAHAQSLLAGTTATDIPHHVHYDLKLYDREGHESTATYDIYRDPIMYERVEVKADNYQLTRISNVRDHIQWLHYTGEMPLKIVDFDEVMDLPTAAVDRFKSEPGSIDAMHPEQLEGAPVLCANDNDGTAICFNPMIRMFAYAQLFNRTIMYDQWLPIGSHTVPGAIRIYEDKKLIVEATGTVEAVKTFPENFLKIPDTPSQPTQQSQYKIIKSKKMDLSQPIYGNVQIAISVDEKGHVTKESIIDSDDKHLEGTIRKYARNLVFEPQMKDGQPSPFEVVLYLEYYPS